MKLSKMIRVFLCVGLFLLLASCQPKKKEPTKIVIADQFGLAYAPLQIMREKGFLEAALPETEIAWVRLGNTAAIREAMLSDELDIGFVGIPPFLIGKDNGMDWKIITGLCVSPVGLVSGNSAIQTVDDIGPAHKIILPQPGSIQHILLSMYCEKHFSKADYFDRQLVTMNHPDGMTAMLHDPQNLLHFTTPPYLFEELKNPDFHQILEGKACFGGEFTFIVGMCRTAFKNQEASYEGFKRALEQTFSFMESHEEEVLEILSQKYEYDKETLRDYLGQNQMKYGPEVLGLEKFSTFMKQNGYLEKDYREAELMWDDEVQ